MAERKVYFIDRKIQGSLARRIGLYWTLSLIGIFVVLAGIPIITCNLAMTDPPATKDLLFETWLQFWPAVCASFLMLPIVIVDCIRLSNRFVGPMFRLRRAMKQLADGETVAPVTFRQDDFWSEFADEFNRLAARVSQPDAATAETTEAVEDEELAAV